MGNETSHKILLVDDDADLLDVYRELLRQLPESPEVRTASNGARAVAMLEAEPFTLLICDLKMPKMDGLQVLSIVRRKYPEMRTVVLTSMADEQYRSRVYALGVDLYWQKPGSESEIRLFLECVESLLGREAMTGFRGVQSKSLMDIIQLECITHSSSVLRITNGPFIGLVWINAGELIDAETDGERGENAFHKILSWKAGSFESLPAEPDRPRTIFKSYNAMLLETAQAIDEMLGQAPGGDGVGGSALSTLTTMTQVDGVEFILRSAGNQKGKYETRGLENPAPLAAWSHATIARLHSLGDALKAGQLEQVTGLGPQRNVGLAARGDQALCVGWRLTLSPGEIYEQMRKVMALWG